MAQPRRLVPVQEPYDTSDEGQVKKAKELAAHREERLKFTLQTLLSTPPGRELLWGWLDRCNIFSTTFIAGDPYSSAFREGERNMGNFILAQIMKADPLAFSLMQQEAKNG